MNITELARKLKINTKELKILLPELGFDVGKKAIKVDDKVANVVIKNWHRLLADYQSRLSLQDNRLAKTEAGDDSALTQAPIALPPQITIKTLAEKLNLPLNVIMKELMKNGIMVSLNERIDFNTAVIIAEDLGKKVVEIKNENEEKIANEERVSIKSLLKKSAASQLKERPPVIVVMGHVDHGKTKLLDNLKKTNVVGEESGGITQHIGAYQITKNNKLITFIDTPGHEAFATMRTRGSKVADIAILVIAADDGVRPQTLEAIRIIKNANLPMIVALNKIDKPTANVEKVKKELAEQNIMPEEWGGKTIFIPISALSGEGLDKLIEAILLTAEIERDNLVTDWQRLPLATVIESHVDNSEGSVATLLVQAGILTTGQIISINNNYYGRIRVMKDWTNQTITTANPGMPVKIIGLKSLPTVGDIIEIKNSDKELNKKFISSSREQFVSPKITSVKKDDAEESEKISLGLILKTDTLGSSEAIVESIAKLNLPENFQIDIIHKGLGNINDNDTNRADAAGAIIIGFHVNIPSTMQEFIKNKKINVQLFEVIYELLDFLKENILKLSKPIIKKQETGSITILKNFKNTKNGQIVGGRVTKGTIASPTKCDIIRNSKIIAQGEITELRSGKEIVRDVSTGQEVGLHLVTLVTIEPKDRLTTWREVREKITL